MILRPYYYDDHGCGAYVFGCGTLGQCAVVDARFEDVRRTPFERRWNPMLSLDRDAFIEALAARGESLAAFDRRCIPVGCVAPPSNTPGILDRRALPPGRLAGLGATPDSHHGLLANVPAKPDEMKQILAFNRGHAEMKVQA